MCIGLVISMTIQVLVLMRGAGAWLQLKVYGFLLLCIVLGF